ncbi:UDP-glucuronate 4-epimerase [Bradyrhizobium japonicum]|jgi:UDP-glucuronate 4-epimerase|uniref:SDR family NAD(P)-dependent oxidoreductase n=1 Tax=Bradyrhizobium TaxID=374 RepID=UPI0004169D89|nr:MULTISPECIES: SDR family NAD(P)-dependent oxidoreductase [Bradyrhizobium]MBR0881679.1 SDR family NAD(P)-dependent oxidoreductase [Bradyrhizobium liaoningense]MBR0946433.1 SDR family NAD(P)-dependent oxidoreductase [Bradyrhizobium liaoningense]MBR1003212.1 SDR family NAD(P)-dependent oxidoreductase [Bradyrhizobium liaoningense]MBR1032358.1 SDR family NAD(P)-dependent oxidoreductase [Bradyrhizobium liaoningense]MCP1743220.1 UDP-glucuronate 4-epimerase [Bradyrhizobium japonicum]
MTDQAILVTGAAGFIGFHVARKLLAEGRPVVGLDNLNSYYDPALKQARLALLRNDSRFAFVEADLADRDTIAALFARHRFDKVVHLAAQAGVRCSIDHPHTYADSNLQGFLNVLEGCRNNSCRHLVYASSSSVYGANTKLPFAVQDRTDHPVSFYAATKKANELMAQSYSHLYRLPVTGLRFFTIYGPWGRPDMALFLFVNAIMAERPIRLFNHGKMRRDFTYIDDVTRVVSKLIDRVPADDPAAANAPSKVYNVGNHHPEELMHVVGLLEQELGRTAIKELLPMQPGDVLETFADVEDLTRDTGFAPSTPIALGVRNFVTWYRDYFKV